MEKSLYGNLHNNWGWILAFGAISAALGTFAILSPFVATIAGVITLGILLLAFGIVEFIQAVSGKIPTHRILNIVLGILTAGAGLTLILYPFTGALSLTLFIAIFLVFIGICKIIFSLTLNYEHWILLLLNGIASVILGSLIYYQWPVSGLWIIGLFIGIDLIMYGWTLIALALKIRTVRN